MSVRERLRGALSHLVPQSPARRVILAGLVFAPLAIAAREAGMEILGISLVTNLAAGLSGEPLNHEEVLEAGRAAASRMGGLLSQVVTKI